MGAGGQRRKEAEEGRRGEGGDTDKDQQVVPTISDSHTCTTPNYMYRHTYFLQEHVPLCHLCSGSEGVLDNAHDRTVGLWGEDHARHHHHLLDLRLCLQALGNMEVHLIPVKVRIVGCGNTGEGRREGRREREKGGVEEEEGRKKRGRRGESGKGEDERKEERVCVWKRRVDDKVHVH